MKKFECELCKKLFSTKSNLTQHLKRKTPCVKEEIIYECGKCGKQFAKENILDKHLQRKNPCDKLEEFKCNKCNTIFYSKYNLNRHLNRKTPCNLMEIDKSLEILRMKQEHQLEMLRMKQEHEKLLLLAKKEIFSEKHNSRLELEDKKLVRKEKTAQIVNNTNIQTQTNIINNFIVKLPTEGVFSATLENCVMSVKKILSHMDMTDAINLVYFSEDICNMPIKFITSTYANDEYPKYKNIWYNKENETFYAIMNEEWKKADIENIREIISRSIKLWLRSMEKKTIKFHPKTQEQENRKIILNSSFKIDYSVKHLDEIAKKALSYEISE